MQISNVIMNNDIIMSFRIGFDGLHCSNFIILALTAFIVKSLTSMPQRGGNKTPKRTSIYFKNGRKLCVGNISLCNERKSRKISYIKLLNSHISENKFPLKGFCT